MYIFMLVLCLGLGGGREETYFYVTYYYITRNIMYVQKKKRKSTAHTHTQLKNRSYDTSIKCGKSIFLFLLIFIYFNHI